MQQVLQEGRDKLRNPDKKMMSEGLMVLRAKLVTMRPPVFVPERDKV